VQVLFAGNSAELLDHFYVRGPLPSHWLAADRRDRARSGPAILPRRVARSRILEIGAWNGRIGRPMSFPLIERDLHSYIFSDVSRGVF